MFAPGGVWELLGVQFRLARRRGLHLATCSRGGGPLLPEPLEPVGELRTFVTLVRQLCDEQRERLRVPGDP